MKWFGRKSAGGDLSRPMLGGAHAPRFGSVGVSAAGVVIGDWPRGYEAQARAAMVTNPVAQRAVRLVAESVGGAPLNISDAGAAKLVGERSGGQALTQTVAMHLLLHGNAFVQLLRGDDGEVVELFALRPERVTIEADARGWPAAYLYRAGDAVTRMPAEDAHGRPTLAHIKSIHPLDDHYGLGCLSAAAGAIAIHDAATRWNKALLDNAARPSGALVFEPPKEGHATLSGDQFDRLRTELDAGFSGALNAGRPMLLEGGLKWQALSLSPAEMDFAGLKAAAARDIALAFGVPPMLLGLPGDATYANYREANRALWRQSVVPLTETIVTSLAQALRAGAGSRFADLTMRVDLDQVPALSEDRERLWAQVTAADFITSEEKRAMLRIGS